VKTRGGRRILPWIYGASLALHVGLLLVAARVSTPERTKTFAIELADLKPKPQRLRPVPPSPGAELSPARALPRTHVAATQQQVARPMPQAATPSVGAEPPTTPATAAGADGFADLGAVALGGNLGAAATAAPATAPSVGLPSARKPTRRVAQLAAADGGCSEPAVKPKTKRPGQITYTKQAQEAEIEGSVRVQVTVDETGQVIAESVVTGLGYGLDERALAAAKATLFEPATLCGKPVVGTKILAFNFALR
jgi:protein TonB